MNTEISVSRYTQNSTHLSSRLLVLRSCMRLSRFQTDSPPLRSRFRGASRYLLLLINLVETIAQTVTGTAKAGRNAREGSWTRRSSANGEPEPLDRHNRAAHLLLDPSSLCHFPAFYLLWSANARLKLRSSAQSCCAPPRQPPAISVMAEAPAFVCSRLWTS